MTESATHPRVGAVLSSGGVRGVFAHTGFLLALRQLDIPLHAIAGCSAGAVVGGIFASGKDIQEWGDTLVNLSPHTFWSPSWLRLFTNLACKRGKGCTGISSTEPALEFIRTQLGARTFEACQIPFYALAKNISTGRKTVFHQGELASRIVASAAIPVLYEPVEIDGDFFSDGALLDLSPTDAICCKEHLDVLIIHHVSHRHSGREGMREAMQQPWTLVSILNGLLFQQWKWYLSDDVFSVKRCPCGCKAIVIVIEPRLPELTWPITDSGDSILHATVNQEAPLLRQLQQSLGANPSLLQDLLDNAHQLPAPGPLFDS